MRRAIQWTHTHTPRLPNQIDKEEMERDREEERKKAPGHPTKVTQYIKLDLSKKGISVR